MEINDSQRQHLADLTNYSVHERSMYSTVTIHLYIWHFRTSCVTFAKKIFAWTQTVFRICAWACVCLGTWNIIFRCLKFSRERSWPHRRLYRRNKTENIFFFLFWSLLAFVLLIIYFVDEKRNFEHRTSSLQPLGNAPVSPLALYRRPCMEKFQSYLLNLYTYSNNSTISFSTACFNWGPSSGELVW